MTAPASARPRVVHVITTLVTGGAERQLELLVTHSQADASVIALFAGGPVADGIEAAGVPVTVLALRGWRKLATWVVLARELRRIKPDLVHVHLLSGQLWGIPAARLAGLPVIATEHSLMDDSIEGRPLTRWLRLLYLALERLTVATVAVSPRTRERLIDFGVRPDRIEVVQNGIDLGRVAAVSGPSLRAELALEGDVPLVLGVGRLDPVKRFDALLDALAPAMRDGWHVVLAGEGPARAALVEQAAAAGVGDRLHLLGARSDVPRLLAGADVLVSLSRDETFGVAIVEAVAAGLPTAFVACPALDGVALPDWVRRIDLALGPVEELATVRQATEELLALDRAKLQEAKWVTAFDIRVTSRHIDDLYGRFLTARRGRHAH